MHSLITVERFVQLVAVLMIVYFGGALVNQTAIAGYQNSGLVEQLQTRLSVCSKALRGGK